MMAGATAYYHWPGLWIDAAPDFADARDHRLPTEVDLTAVADEMMRVRVSDALQVKVLREGRFVFGFADDDSDERASFDERAAIAIRRVTMMNAHLVCLYTAVARTERFLLPKLVVAPMDTISSRDLDDTGYAVSDARTAHLLQADAPGSYNLLSPASSDWRIRGRTVISRVAVHESFALLTAVLEHETGHLLAMLDLYARACRAYEDHDYSISLVASWTIVERLLDALWERYIEQNREREVDGHREPFINADRKQRLTGRDFTASIVAEILSLLDVVPNRLFVDLGIVRAARNQWLHTMRPVERATAERAVDVALELLRRAENLDVEAPLLPRLQG